MRHLLFTLLGLLTVSPLTAGEPPQPGEGFVGVTGGPVWYHVAGSGPGVPLLLLHGGPGGTSCGFSRLELLGDQRPLIRYDQLGSGRSGRPEDSSLWQVDRFIEELHTLRLHLGLDRLHLLGHSWGASLAAAYVLAKGTDGIVSLTLSSPLLSTPAWIADANLLRQQLPEDVQRVLAEHEAAGTTDSEAYQQATEVFYERFVYAGPAPEEAPECAGAPWNPVVYEYMWGPTEFYATGNLLEFDLTARLHEIDVPTLFIAGEHDEARPETVETFRQRIPGARLEIIQGAAHATISKAPERYATVLEEFLDAAEAQP